VQIYESYSSVLKVLKTGGVGSQVMFWSLRVCWAISGVAIRRIVKINVFITEIY